MLEIIHREEGDNRSSRRDSCFSNTVEYKLWNAFCGIWLLRLMEKIRIGTETFVVIWINKGLYQKLQFRDSMKQLYKTC